MKIFRKVFLSAIASSLMLLVGCSSQVEPNTEYNMVPFDGEGPALTALLGGHIDATVAGFTAAYENAKAVRYWKDWQSTTAWVLQEAGAAKVNPAELNIPKKE